MESAARDCICLTSLVCIICSTWRWIWEIPNNSCAHSLANARAIEYLEWQKTELATTEIQLWRPSRLILHAHHYSNPAYPSMRYADPQCVLIPKDFSHTQSSDAHSRERHENKCDVNNQQHRACKQESWHKNPIQHEMSP
jgi:hypothetical protein